MSLLTFEKSLARYALIMGEPFPIEATLTEHPSDDFIALARPAGDGVEVVISAGVTKALETLWHDAMALSDQLPEENQINVVHASDAIEASMVFLMLHELHHSQIGHLDLVGPAGLSETSFEPELGLTGRSAAEPTVLDGLDKDEAIMVRRCLELQADHDALEIHLDHYSTEGWGYIRFYMASAMAVMVLIEQQDDSDAVDRCYPLSATRIFQAFAVLALLWQPRPQSDWEAPSDEEIIAYHQQVVAPAVSDAMILAQAAGATAIIDTGTAIDDLFNDMRMLQEPHQHDLTTLKTAGAREYASLMLANQKAIELLGSEKFAS